MILSQLEITCHTVNIKTSLPIIDKDTLIMTGFSCHYCSKVLCTRQRLDSHIMSYHRKHEVENPTPTKIQRLDSLVRDKTEDDFKRIELLAPEQQTGGGYDVGPSDDDDEEENDDSEGHVSEEDNSEASEDEEEEEGVESEEEEDVAEDYDIFDKVLQLAKQNLAGSEEEATHRDLQR